jgi:hypothetical protein
MSDGVADGVDVYGIPADWHAAIATSTQDLDRLVQLVHDAEDTDPECTRWPRSKRHDDKAASLVLFHDERGARLLRDG